MLILIATAGRPDDLAATLRSITDDATGGGVPIRVVENGPRAGAAEVCDSVRSEAGHHAIEYRHHAPAGKSVALNAGLADVPDDEFVVMFDDDVLVRPGTVAAYARAAERHPQGRFFGGPFEAAHEIPPPSWLRPFLPASAVGWWPDPETFDPAVHRFLGFNWAAKVGDLRDAGGFDPRFGPGGTTGAVGQESQMQLTLLRRGLRSCLVPDAVVSHRVPRQRCDIDFALRRAYRHGVARGVRAASLPRGQQRWRRFVYGTKLRFRDWQTRRFDGNVQDQRTLRIAFKRDRLAGWMDGIDHPAATDRRAA